MSSSLRVLFLEDNSVDMEMELAALELAGYKCEWDRVDNRKDFLSRLRNPDYDLIIADYHLPSFDGISGLRLFVERQLDIPFILVSGTVGEEVAIESIKAGATDYVLKTHLGRLGEIVRRALREKAEQRQRKLSEEALRTAESRYRDLFENANDIIYTQDIDGNFTSINKKGEYLTGYSRDEVIGSNVASFVTPEYLTVTRENTGRKLAGECDSTTYELEVICKDGRRLPLEVSSRLIYIDGGPVGVQGIARDISERKETEIEHRRLEEQLLQAQKMESIGRLAGGVAHDFNNLLTAIIGYSQLLLGRLGPQDPMRKEAEEILKAGQRAAALTSQLLAFSRRQRLERKTISINDTIGNLMKMLRRIIGEDVDVNVQAGAGLAPAFADPTQVEQVLLNLAVNARDAMPDGGQLVIQTRNAYIDEAFCRENAWARPGDYVRITVSDSGEGMDNETLERIFEPFFTTKELNKGTGLGLAVVYGIIQQHEGLINVVSEPGRGATFDIYMPVRRDDLDEELEVVETPLRGGTETVLVAEDEAALQSLTREVLSGLGYRVLVAGNGQEALELYKKHNGSIDLLLLDLVMPRMGGREVFLHLRAAGSHIPVIFMTGYSPEMTQMSFIESTGALLIQKPYSVIDLGNRVRDALDNKGAGARGSDGANTDGSSSSLRGPGRESGPGSQAGHREDQRA